MSGTQTQPPPDPTALPGYDFANKGTLVGLLQELRKQIKKDIDGMLPASVISYDRVSNLATVQPDIYMVTTDATLVGRAPLASVPVLALGGGGFLISFPLVAGSRGWIKSNDRDISLYLQAGAAAAPNSQRMHSFSDGLFIPDVVNGFTIAGGDLSKMVIQSLDGSIKITLSETDVDIVATENVNINAANINLTGALNINGTPFLNYKPDGVQTGDGKGTGLSAT